MLHAGSQSGHYWTFALNQPGLAVGRRRSSQVLGTSNSKTLMEMVPASMYGAMVKVIQDFALSKMRKAEVQQSSSSF